MVDDRLHTAYAPDGSDCTFSNKIEGATLEKIGAGTLTLDNPFDGNLVVKGRHGGRARRGLQVLPLQGGCDEGTGSRLYAVL